MKQTAVEFKHTKVVSESGNELFFDEQGKLIKKQPKQTAVEWLEKQLSSKSMVTKSLFEQAKEMEKEQIIDAYEYGYSDSDNTFELNKEYYNETFKNK